MFKTRQFYREYTVYTSNDVKLHHTGTEEIRKLYTTEYTMTVYSVSGCKFAFNSYSVPLFVKRPSNLMVNDFSY